MSPLKLSRHGQARTLVTVLLALLSLPALAACGGDGSSGTGGGTSGPPKLDGTYKITHHTESKAMSGGPSATCTKEGADASGPGFLRLATDDTGRLGWGQCDSSSDVSTCTDEFYSFDKVGDAWQIGAATSASESGGLCTLFHAEGGVTVLGDNPKKIRIEIKEWDAYPMMGEKPCTLDSAKALSGDTDCAEHLVIEATAM
ncbi:MAG: hypothetical protein U0359_16185 [Byssovorax sp.]